MFWHRIEAEHSKLERARQFDLRIQSNTSLHRHAVTPGNEASSHSIGCIDSAVGCTLP